MKVEDLLKEAMGEQKLSEDARERIVSGALKSVSETASEPVKRPFYSSPLFRRVTKGICTGVAVAFGLFLVLTFLSDQLTKETKDGAQSSAMYDAEPVLTQEGEQRTEAANKGDSANAQVGIMPSSDRVYYKITEGKALFLGSGKDIKSVGDTYSPEPATENQEFDLMSEVLVPVRKYIEDLKEPAPYVLIEVSEEDGVVKAVLEPATTSVLNEYKLDADAFDGSLSLAPQQQEEKGEENRGTLTVYLEKDPETGSYRVVSAISDPYIGK
ncbi:MAG: hypothetical protein J5648_00310 [Lachnospiraceae bacterium]|nr:hypothetical protein [Lachnospiraceae bacterium]